MADIKRNMANKVLRLLQQFPVVVILGARQTGKTTLSRQLVPDWKYIDLENPADYERLVHDPHFFFEQYPEHVIIDEAQEYPELFRTLRGVIDSKRQLKNRFLLTGSSSPELLKNVSESLAGRVAFVELGTLKANEFYEQPLSDFYELFQHKLTKKSLQEIMPRVLPRTNKQMQQLWLRGGYPEPILQGDHVFYEQWMQQYRDTYVHRDIAKLFPHLNKLAYQRFLSVLGKISGTIINRSEVARTLEVSEKTVRDYLAICEGTFLWRQLPSFERNIVKSIIKMPKGYLRDNGLLHFMLRIHDFENLLEHPIVGHSFEAFVIEEILKGLQATFVTNWQAHYYRTKNGAEIDLILDGPFGLLPIEIKYGVKTSPRQLTSLIQFVKEHQLPFGVLINQADTVEWITPEVVQIPAGFL